MNDISVFTQGDTVMKRYVLGRSVRSRTYLADKGRSKLLFDTENMYSKEYSLMSVLAAFAAVIFGILFTVFSIKKGMARKKTIKLQKKEIKRLEKICGDMNIQ